MLWYFINYNHLFDDIMITCSSSAPNS